MWKTIGIIIGILILISIGFNIWQFYDARSNNKLLSDSRVTIEQLGTELDRQTVINQELQVEIGRIRDGAIADKEDLNGKLQSALDRIAELQGIIDNIGIELSENIEDIQSIIRVIRSIREALEQYYSST